MEEYILSIQNKGREALIHNYRTKEALADSLKKQMVSTPFNKISIQNVTQGCGLTRQAFYYHFQDIYELLGWIYSHEVVEGMSKSKSWKNAYLKVFQYIEKNKSFCMNTYHSIGREHLERFLFANTAQFLSQKIYELSEGMQVTESKKKFVVDFYTPAFIALVAKWMDSGMKEKPENIILNLSELLDGTIMRVLKQYEEKRK